MNAVILMFINAQYSLIIIHKLTITRWHHKADFLTNSIISHTISTIEVNWYSCLLAKADLDFHTSSGKESSAAEKKIDENVYDFFLAPPPTWMTAYDWEKVN